MTRFVSIRTSSFTNSSAVCHLLRRLYAASSLHDPVTVAKHHHDRGDREVCAYAAAGRVRLTSDHRRQRSAPR